MGLSRTRDLTLAFNANGFVNLDVGAWDDTIVQVVGPTGTVSFNTTNDGGAITGVTDGNATSATNWTALQGTNQATGSGVTTIAGGAGGSVKFTQVGKYIQITGTGVTVNKLIVDTFKISN
jgi:hypothetical protein